MSCKVSAPSFLESATSTIENLDLSLGQSFRSLLRSKADIPPFSEKRCIRSCSREWDQISSSVGLCD